MKQHHLHHSQHEDCFDPAPKLNLRRKNSQGRTACSNVSGTEEILVFAGGVLLYFVRSDGEYIPDTMKQSNNIFFTLDEIDSDGFKPLENDSTIYSQQKMILSNISN